MLIRGIIGCMVGCIITSVLIYAFNLHGVASFFVGTVCGAACTITALNI